MLNVVMLNVVMLNVIILNVVMLNAVVVNVMAPSEGASIFDEAVLFTIHKEMDMEITFPFFEKNSCGRHLGHIL